MEWENGKITVVLTSTLIADNPVTITTYAKEKNLQHLDGWKCLKPIARQDKKLDPLLINQPKLRSYRINKIFMFGY